MGWRRGKSGSLDFHALIHRVFVCCIHNVEAVGAELQKKKESEENTLEMSMGKLRTCAKLLRS